MYQPKSFMYNVVKYLFSHFEVILVRGSIYKFKKNILSSNNILTQIYGKIFQCHCESIRIQFLNTIRI